MKAIFPVSGWCLARVVDLDRYAPGIAGSFLRASNERRQVIAALLAARPAPSSAEAAVELAKLASGARHSEMLEAAFTIVPSGLRGALARSGPQPHSRSYYRILYDLLSAGSASLAGVIQQLDSLDMCRLRTARSLPADICTVHLVKMISSARMATDVISLIDLLTRNGIERKGLAEALRRVTIDTQLPDFWDRWSQKLSFPPHPVNGTEDYVPITNGAELRRTALIYRNCARRYLAQVMEGQSAFAEFHLAGKRAVVHLGRSEGAWVLEGMFGKDNSMIPFDLRTAAASYLADRGIQTPQVASNVEGEWAALRRLSRSHMFGF